MSRVKLPHESETISLKLACLAEFMMLLSGRPDQANTGLTEPDWSGNFYQTEPDLTEPDLIAYKFSNIPSFKVSETLNSKKLSDFEKKSLKFGQKNSYFRTFKSKI